MTRRHWFVTGTDTGIGKTLVSSAMLHLLAASGLRAVGMKPVAAGLALVDHLAGPLGHPRVGTPWRRLIAPHGLGAVDGNVLRRGHRRRRYRRPQLVGERPPERRPSPTGSRAVPNR